MLNRIKETAIFLSDKIELTRIMHALATRNAWMFDG